MNENTKIGKNQYNTTEGEPLKQLLTAIHIDDGMQVDYLCKKYKDLDLAKKRFLDISLTTIACDKMAHNALNALLINKAPIVEEQLNLVKLIKNCNVKSSLILSILIKYGLFIPPDKKKELVKICPNDHIINMIILT